MDTPLIKQPIGLGMIRGWHYISILYHHVRNHEATVCQGRIKLRWYSGCASRDAAVECKILEGMFLLISKHVHKLDDGHPITKFPI